MKSDIDRRSPDERVLVEGAIPDGCERRFRGLADIARNPLEKPLATLAAALILAAVGYQSLVAASAHGPAVGLLILATATLAYLLSKRLWAVQHGHIVRELAKDGELDRLRD